MGVDSRLVCLVGVVVRRYIDFLILLIPAPLVYPCSSCICSFSFYFLFIKKKFFSFLYRYFFVN